jgi:hypothetical protein
MFDEAYAAIAVEYVSVTAFVPIVVLKKGGISDGLPR